MDFKGNRKSCLISILSLFRVSVLFRKYSNRSDRQFQLDYCIPCRVWCFFYFALFWRFNAFRVKSLFALLSNHTMLIRQNPEIGETNFKYASWTIWKLLFFEKRLHCGISVLILTSTYDVFLNVKQSGLHGHSPITTVKLEFSSKV